MIFGRREVIWENQSKETNKAQSEEKNKRADVFIHTAIGMFPGKCVTDLILKQCFNQFCKDKSQNDS